MGVRKYCHRIPWVFPYAINRDGARGLGNPFSVPSSRSRKRCRQERDDKVLLLTNFSWLLSLVWGDVCLVYGLVGMEQRA